MKTKLLLIISCIFISISVSLAQGHENARNAPLPGSPEPIYPPGCIPPPVPVVSLYVDHASGQILPGLLGWKETPGAIGYYLLLSIKGSSTLNLSTTVSSSEGHPYGVYSCVYTDLPNGSYTFFVQSFNSGCPSNLSKPFNIEITSPPVPQDIDPGNNPYDVDLNNLLLDYIGKGGSNDRVAASPNNVNMAFPGIGGAHATGIYPTPVSGTLNVSLPFVLSSSAKFLVNDVNGRSVNNLSIGSLLEGITQIETSSIPPGIYFLTIISEHNHFKQRFIKN